MFVYLLKSSDIISSESFIIDDNLFCWFDKNDLRNIEIKPSIFDNLEDILTKNNHIIIIEDE